MPEKNFTYAPQVNLMDAYRKKRAMEEMLPIGQDGIDSVFKLHDEALLRAYPSLTGSNYLNRLLTPVDIHPVSYQTMRRRERKKLGMDQNWLLGKLVEAGVSRRSIEEPALSVKPGVDAHLYQFSGSRRWYWDKSALSSFESEDAARRVIAAENLTEALSFANLRLLCDEVDVTASVEVRQLARTELVGLLTDFKIGDERAKSILMSYQAKKKRITQRGGITLVYMDEERAAKGQADFSTGASLNNLMLRYFALKVIDQTAEPLKGKGLISAQGNEDIRKQIRGTVERNYGINPRSGLFADEEALLLTFIMGELPQAIRELVSK